MSVNPFAPIVSDSTCGINTIRLKCIAKCINLWLLSDAMWVEHSVTLRHYAGKRVKKTQLFLQDAECTILCDYIPIQNILKGNFNIMKSLTCPKNFPLMSWTFSTQKALIPYWQTVNQTCENRSNQLWLWIWRAEVEMHLIQRPNPNWVCKDYTPNGPTDVMSIHILEDHGKSDLQEISTLHDHNTYCKCIINSLHIPLVQGKFLKHVNILNELVQNGDKLLRP